MAKLKLSRLLKKKSGGTFFGNMLRKVGGGLADKVGLKEAFDLINPIPGAQPVVQAAAQKAITTAMAAPQMGAANAFNFAASARQNLLAAGATEKEAEAVEHQVVIAAQSPAAPVNNLSKEDIGKILVGAAKGAKDGAVDTYLDETKDGQETKKAAIEEQGQKIMPFAFLGLLVLFLFTQAKK